MLTVQVIDRHSLPALLDDMRAPILISDTRQRADKHNNVLVAAARRGIEVRPAELPVGDYMICTPEGLAADFAIDSKRGIQELQQNTYIDRDRVSREMQRARDMGVHLVFLVELAPEEHTLCDACPRAGQCAHAGYCEQHDVQADFADAYAALADFAAFARSGRAIVLACWSTETGDALLDLFTGVTTQRVVQI